MTDRAAFGESVARFDDDAGETIRSATYLFLVLSDLLTRIGIVREQALRRTLRSDAGEYLLSGHRAIFEIGAYKTIQGQKIGVISDIGEHVHVVYDLVNIFDGSGNFKKITEDRSRLIVDACERLGAQIDSLRTELMKFRFSLDLGQDYQKEHNNPPSSA
ncbi:hypothetical protein [Acidovorax sp. A79]|uniref:hypothetical protein n=1 Tax=Acidovorax sp. A79 TaxID=3056107 RepID=UPI0034E8F6A7